VTDAFDRGALAAMLVTTGPTGEAIALNVSATKPGFQKPVAVLAPKDAAPFVAAATAGESATLIVDAEVGRRPAYNLIARLDRGAAKTLIVSTPRSGWFTCAAERGAGVAVWLSLAHGLAGQAGGEPGVRRDQRARIHLSRRRAVSRAPRAQACRNSSMWVHGIIGPCTRPTRPMPAVNWSM
jgi:hypothetical protein